jgi:hypothetical protein
MKHIGFIAAGIIVLLISSPTWAWASDHECQTVGGMLMTNIGAIEGVTNLGPVTGDLQGRSLQPSRVGTAKATFWSSTIG